MQTIQPQSQEIRDLLEQAKATQQRLEALQAEVNKLKAILASSNDRMTTRLGWQGPDPEYGNSSWGTEW